MKDWVLKVDLHKPTLVVAPGHLHLTLLEALNGLSFLPDFDLMTRESWRHQHTPHLTKDAPLKLVSHLQLSPDRLKDIQAIIPYLNHSVSDPFLNEVVQFLKNEHLWTEKPWKKIPLKPSIVFMGYSSLKKIDESILETIYKDADVTFIKEELSNHPVPLYETVTEYDEVVALANLIVQKINQEKIPLNHFKIHIPSSSYETLVPLIFPRFNLTYQILKPTSLWDYPITKKVFQQLGESKESWQSAVDDAFKTLKALKAHHLKRKITSKIAQILTEYYRFEGSIQEGLPFVLESLKAHKISPAYTQEGIMLGDLLSHPVKESDYVYICGLNEGALPASVSESGTLSEATLKELGKETLLERSIEAGEEAFNLLHHPSVKGVFYSHKAFSDEKIPSSLIDKLKATGKLTPQTMEASPVRYSVAHDLLEVGKKHHAAMMYGIDDPEFQTLTQSVLKHTDYPKPTTHKNEKLSLESIDQLLKEKPKTSYSKIEDYFKCEFRYLLKHLLDVEEESDNRASRIMGSFVHEVLSQMETLPEDTQERYAGYHALIKKLASYEKEALSAEETFYLENIFESIDRYIDHVKTFHHESMYEIFALEKRYDIALKGKHIKKMTGIVDKIMAYQDQFVVVDYKSSDRTIHLKEYEYGLQSQLPFYMNIVEKHSDLSLKPSGFFYHPFTMKLPKNDGKTTPAEQEKKAWQMKGYIDPDQVSLFDPLYDTHSFIKGMNVKKDGTFYKSAQLLSTAELKALGDWMELKVDEAIKHMEEGSFKINPKGTMNNSPSCQYCQFKDICFKTKDDYHPFTYKDDEAFLSMLVGGQDDSN